MVNTNQSDTDHDGYGDLCDTSNQNTIYQGLGIRINSISSYTTPSSVVFQAIISGQDCGSGYYRQLGDKTRAQGKTVNTTYKE